MSETGAVLIAGPTASGKSRLAVELARERNGVIINADSMQVYAELRVLTARPSPEDEAAAPHRLYGHVPASKRYSVGAWLEDTASILAEVRAAGRLPIFVGGTGLYFKALTEGLSEISAIPAEARADVEAETRGLSTADIHARLSAVDPADASVIRPSDRARIVRALEVFRATGLPMAKWRGAAGKPLVDIATAEPIVLDVSRGVLHERIAERAARMIADGAMDEVRALSALRLDPDASPMKAIGVRELLAHLDGRATLEEAIAGLATETRRYARRQITWFRNQMAHWPRRSA